MANKVNDHFELLDSRDDGYIVDDIHVRGGYTVVSTITERNSIPIASRKIGMTVYVESEKREYVLDSGFNDSNWKEKILTGIELPEYAKKDSAALEGIATLNTGEQILDNIITAYNTDNGSDTSTLSIILSSNDLKYAGEASIVRGQNSGAVAVVLAFTSNVLTIPSLTAGFSSTNRSGNFIVGEKLILQATPSLPRTADGVMTRLATETLCITKLGGNMYGNIVSEPLTRHETTSTITETINHSALGLVEICIDMTNELQYTFDGMRVITRSGVTVPTLKISNDFKGFIVSSAYASSFTVGETVVIEDRITSPILPQHLTTKQYVDDKNAKIEVLIDSSYFTNNGQVLDTVDGVVKDRFTFTIPSSILKDGWPNVGLFLVEDAGSVTEYTQVSSTVYRYVVRDDKSSNQRELVIECWGKSPSTLKVVIQ